MFGVKISRLNLDRVELIRPIAPRLRFVCTGCQDVHQPHQLIRDGRHIAHEVHEDVFDRALRHPGEHGVVRILHQRPAPVFLDRQQTSRAVVEGTREHHPQHAPPVRARRGAEERIDGGTVAVLVRAFHDAHVVALHEKVMTRRCDVDAAVQERLSVHRVRRPEGTSSREDLRQAARRFFRNVERNRHGGRQLLRQHADERGE